MADEILFLTVADRETLPGVRLLIDSLRTFGGELRQAPFWVFTSDPESVRPIADEWTWVKPIHLEDPANAYLFERKVAACARAEQLAPPETNSLVWVDASLVIAAPPVRFFLGKDHDAAFRPVHIRNVGLPPNEPLDAFWRGIYTAVGVQDEADTITSFVDGQVLRRYFNSHAFSIRPGLGLMELWYTLFMQLSHDRKFQSESCADGAHQVFLFQALLSALLASQVDPNRLLMLPPTYNYPYNLQERIPLERRLRTLNETVCFTREELSVRPESLIGIDVQEPLRSWLAARTT